MSKKNWRILDEGIRGFCIILFWLVLNMIQILEELIINNTQSQNTQILDETNEHLSNQIAELQQRINNLDNSIVKKLPEHSNRLDALKDILSIDQQELIDEQEALNHQQKCLNIFYEYVQIFLEDSGDDPRRIESKIKRLRNKTEEVKSIGCTRLQSDLQDHWTNLLVESLSKKISSLVRSFPNSLNINFGEIENLKDLLNSQICQNLVINIYKNAFVYDVPSYSYQLTTPTQLIENNNKLLVKKQKLIFTQEKSSQNYHHLKHTIVTLKELCNRILKIVQSEELVQAIKKQIQNREMQILSTVEYILPYVGIQRRKELVGLLSRQENAEMTIFDILVKLRTKGQDGDSMGHNIDLLIEKIKRDPECFKDVQSFLYICQSENNSLGIAFFVCEQLINELQESIEISNFLSLVQIRESIRFLIHHPK